MILKSSLSLSIISEFDPYPQQRNFGHYINKFIFPFMFGVEEFKVRVHHSTHKFYVRCNGFDEQTVMQGGQDLG